MPALLVLVLAAGLRRGRRFAWWAAMVFHVLLLALGTFYAIDYYNWAVENDLLDEGFSWVAWLVPLVLLPVLIIVLLLLTRRSFTVQAPVGIYRKFGLSVLGVVLAPVGVCTWSSAPIVADQFTPTATVGRADRRLPDPVAAQRLSLHHRAGVRADRRASAGSWPTGCRCLVWAVILLGLLRSFVAARVESTAEDRARARDMLERNGTTALAYLTTWDGNSYWFSADGRSFVAYRVEGGVAITTGDPVGPPEDLAATVEEFVAFCNAENWTPCLYSTTEAVKDVTDGFGWPSLQVAEETVLPLGKLAFTGKKFQDIRTSISRAGKGGITAEWLVLPRGAAGDPRPDPGDLRGMGVGQGAARDGLHPRRSRRTGRPGGALPDRDRRGPDHPRDHQLDAVLPRRCRRSAGPWTSCGAAARASRASWSS